jgi:hypothetical protein
MSRSSSIAGLAVLLGVAAPAGAFADVPAAPTPAVATAGPTTRTTGDSPLVRYAARLEAEAARILAPEVVGTVKTAVKDQAVALWASLTVSEWGQRAIAAAPTLSKAVPVLVRRTEVLWSEERVVDAYASPVLQQASVHALMRGLGKVMEQLGQPLPAPPPPAPVVAPAPIVADGFAGEGILAPTPRPAPVAAAAPRPGPRPAPRAAAPSPTALVSPVQVEAYKAALAADAARVLKFELEGKVLEAAVARKGQLRAQPTVAGWQAALIATSPSLSKAAAVLVRRTEVLLTQSGVRDAYEHPLVQRAAVEGLEAGLERILAQFGK